MQFIQLNPYSDGPVRPQPVQVNAESITHLVPNGAGANARTEVYLTSFAVEVVQTPAEILALIAKEQV